MPQSRFTETESVNAAKRVEMGIPVRQTARKYRLNCQAVVLAAPSVTRETAHWQAASLHLASPYREPSG